MYENHRDNFGRRPSRSEEERQRYGQYWRDQAWSGDRYLGDDEDRPDSRGERRYGAGGDRSPYRENAYRTRQQRDDQPYHHDHDDDRHYYAGLDRYADNREQQTFTGSQNSWAIPSPADSGGYVGGYGGGHAARGYGRDYLDRGRSRESGYGGANFGSSDRGFFEKAGDEIASWFGDDDARRRREDDHRGRGPKDYVRSDDRIRDDVHDRLTDDWRVDASNITVVVEHGEVTLNGTVTAREAKRRAEDIVEDVSGVKHVQNNLRVAQTPSATGGAYDDNWALNQRSTAEGGTLGKDAQGTKAPLAKT